MASPKNSPAPKSPVGVDEDEFPLVPLLGIVKHAKGFVPVFVQVRGKRVVSEEALSSAPVKKHEAENIFMWECQKRGVIS